MQDPYKNLEQQFSSDSYEFLNVFTYRSYRLYGKDYFCDICLVKNRERKRVFVRLQKRWHGLSKKMIAAGDKKPRWIIVQSYNFPQKFEFERARKIFNEISKGTIQDNKDVVTSLTNTDLAKDEMKRLRERIRKIQKSKKRDKKSQEEIVKLKEQIKFLDTENKALKKNLLKSQIPEFRKAVKAAVSYLDKKGENFFQKFLEKNDWIFGPNYEEVIPKRKADPENQPDFILKRYDGFSDIVEIEKPDKPLFTKPDKSKKSQPTAALIHAISQTMDYIDSYNQKFKELFYDDTQRGVQNPIHPYYPKGLVIIGRDKNTDRKKLRQLNNFLHNIIVLTYDEFLKQSERMIDILEK